MDRACDLVEKSIILLLCLLVQQKVEVFEIKRSASSKLFDYNLVLKRWNSKKITWSWFEVWFLGIGMLWHSFARVEDFKFLYYFIVPDLDFFLNVNVYCVLWRQLVYHTEWSYFSTSSSTIIFCVKMSVPQKLFTNNWLS